MSEKNERIVCLVVSGESGSFNCIDGHVLTERIRKTLDAYLFTDTGFENVMAVILGNEEPPIHDELPKIEGDE